MVCVRLRRLGSFPDSHGCCVELTSHSREFAGPSLFTIFRGRGRSLLSGARCHTESKHVPYQYCMMVLILVFVMDLVDCILNGKINKLHMKFIQLCGGVLLQLQSI